MVSRVAYAPFSTGVTDSITSFSLYCQQVYKRNATFLTTENVRMLNEATQLSVWYITTLDGGTLPYTPFANCAVHPCRILNCGIYNLRGWQIVVSDRCFSGLCKSKIKLHHIQIILWSLSGRNKVFQRCLPYTICVVCVCGGGGVYISVDVPVCSPYVRKTVHGTARISPMSNVCLLYTSRCV